jgi:hypothetical protein
VSGLTSQKSRFPEPSSVKVAEQQKHLREQEKIGGSKMCTLKKIDSRLLATEAAHVVAGKKLGEKCSRPILDFTSLI